MSIVFIKLSNGNRNCSLWIFNGGPFCLRGCLGIGWHAVLFSRDFVVKLISRSYCFAIDFWPRVLIGNKNNGWRIKTEHFTLFWWIYERLCNVYRGGGVIVRKIYEFGFNSVWKVINVCISIVLYIMYLLYTVVSDNSLAEQQRLKKENLQKTQ